ncbi:glucosamine-6-phosphate deaminase-like protein [Lacunisphaera limnophila]|uniref:Glucosamine-6-phosphate deaminase-like protein n=1 Tax=Lacunisphaera limnophila TaxID=1838286 RepID=A0A1D8AVU2_9BACT|nr:PIG-L deacetylase family protein [Lacunisphaera limnophila]AOS45003.1 glucosamine-6-phosphate deaminase-like protein [Lacunisphaera limnophila]
MKRKHLLVVAPHPDDEILGAGGTMAKYAKNGIGVSVLTIAGHRPPLYTEEVYQQTVREAKAAHRIIGVERSIFLDLPATTLGGMKTHELNGLIARAVQEVRPTIVLLPYPDRHVDHRVIFDSTLVATRPVNQGVEIEIVAAYETLSETHWNAPHIEPNFTPNWVCDITQTVELKLEALSCFQSQIPPFPGARSVEALKALAMFRGTQAGFAFGEGFHLIRMRD